MGWSVAQQTGLTYHRPQLSVKGYTLVTPLRGDSTLLLDMDGRVVHRWRFEGFSPGLGKLLPNGHLLLRGNDPALPPPPPDDVTKPPPPMEEHVRRLGGGATILREVDWDGSLVWEYRNPMMHHDFVRLENGHTLFPEWVPLADEFARRVRGGERRAREQLPPLLGDDIVEVDGDGTEVRRIHLWELLDPRRDPICPLDRRWQWTHLNSIDVSPQGDIVFSCRNNSRVGIIDGDSGQLRWKYGSPNISHQHDARWVPGGNVQIFDNGMHTFGLPRSRVVEVDPETDTEVWVYEAAEQFFSAHISGAQRLPGGNVLICEGTSGRVFEVTRGKEIAWEWLSPFVSPHPISGHPSSWLYRAERYLPDHPALAGRVLDHTSHQAFNRLHGLA